jgi:hypothetical protein
MSVLVGEPSGLLTIEVSAVVITAIRTVINPEKLTSVSLTAEPF